MDELETALSAMYPSMTPPPQGANVFKTDNEKLIDQCRDEGVSLSACPDEVLAAKMYPDGGNTGGALGDYSHILTNLFDVPEYEARLIKDEGALEALAADKSALNAVMVDLQVGSTAAGAMMSLANDYMRNPRDSVSIETLTENTIADLRKAEGTRTDGLIKGAQRVCAEISRKVPRFNDVLNAGLGSDPAFIRTAIAIAKRKGYC